MVPVPEPKPFRSQHLERVQRRTARKAVHLRRRLIENVDPLPRRQQAVSRDKVGSLVSSMTANGATSGG